ncbi:MAG: hypothetical protein DWQ01_18895 [Planctomycetota bacterium]|nr:MAG: hypothetical protein DWQ01_18895 [Planctomycetota bacterium]
MKGIHIFMTLLAMALAFSPPAPAKPAAQDPVRFSQLARDQRKLADQARRLLDLLETIENREREAGNSSRADLLAKARKRLASAGPAGDLAAALEDVARDLTQLQAGSALEHQAESIELLQEILDFLLEREIQNQLQNIREQIAERRQQLEDFARRQQELLAETRALSVRELEKQQTDAAWRKALAEKQRQLSEEVEAFSQEENEEGREARKAEEAARAGQEAAQKLSPSTPSENRPESESDSPREEGERSESESGERSENESTDSEKADPSQESQSGEEQTGQPSPQEESNPDSEAQENSQDPSGDPNQNPQNQENSPPQQPQQPRPPQQPGEQLDEAQQKQQEALQKLQEEAQEASRQEQQLQDMEELEALISLEQEATALLERHQTVLKPLKIMAEESGGRRRLSARVQLRKWSEEEKALAEDAGDLLLEVRERGADATPFLLETLVEDHQRLGRRLGPPSYRAGMTQVSLGEQIERAWLDLIEAIRTEAERVRQRMEQERNNPNGPQQEPPQEESPLVNFAEEVQLLKRMEEDLRDRLSRLKKRRDLLAEAGMEFDQDEREELEALVERQNRLRRLFDAILERLEEASQQQEKEEA